MKGGKVPKDKIKSGDTVIYINAKLTAGIKKPEPKRLKQQINTQLTNLGLEIHVLQILIKKE
jgi:hypothetical protein